jgi:hypothetical protein
MNQQGKVSIRTDGALDTDAATGKMVIRLGEEFVVRPGSPNRLVLRIPDASLLVDGLGARVNPAPVLGVTQRLDSQEGLEDAERPYRGPTGGYSWETVLGAKRVWVAEGRQMVVGDTLGISAGGELDVEGTVVVT